MYWIIRLIINRVLGRQWGRVVSGSMACLLGIMLLIGSAATGQTNLLSYGFWLLFVAGGVWLLLLGIRGLNAQKASAQVSYGYGAPLGYGQPGYPPQAGTGYGQPQYGAPYGQPAVPQYPAAAPYGQAAAPQYPPQQPYGQPAAPQYPPQQPYGQPPAGQYPYQ